jgi:hypothetical protein
MSLAPAVAQRGFKLPDMQTLEGVHTLSVNTIVQKAAPVTSESEAE